MAVEMLEERVTRLENKLQTVEAQLAEQAGNAIHTKRCHQALPDVESPMNWAEGVRG